MIKRLIFDVDNTLITNIKFKNTIGKTLDRLGIYSEENVENFLKGINTYESIYDNYNRYDYTKHMEESMNVTVPDNFLDVFVEELKGAVPEKNDKLINTIDTLSKKYELVLLTNYFGISQLNRLNNMGIGKYFTETYGEHLIKPYKQAYISACGPHKPEECVMIGDNPHLDVEGALNAGLKAILVNTKNIDTSNLDIIVVDKVEDINEDVLNKLI